MSIKALTFFLAISSTSALFDCGKNTDCSSCTTNKCCWNSKTNTCEESFLFLGLSCASNDQTIHTYNCPKAPPANFVYTDDFGRNKVLPYIAATYGNKAQAQTCLTNRNTGAQVVGQYEQTNCSATLAISSNDQAFVVAFRGAQGLEQFLLTGLDLFTGTKCEFPINGSTYLLYHSCFFGIWNTAGLGAQLQQFKNDPTYANYELWVFGHSLGGSLATLTSSYAVYTNLFTSDKVKQVTTGATRSGDLKLAQAHDNLVPNSYRIVNVADLITKLPPKLSLDDAGTYHHRYEVWYDKNMLPNAHFEICDQAEDPSCSFSNPNWLAAEYHNSYFNVTLDSWYQNGCQY